MVTKHKMALVGVMAASLCQTIAFAQEDRGTPEQRAACATDAFRLCSSYIPDPRRVESCLRQRKSDLSETCRSVFEQSAGPLASRIK
jgi:hypothetical protein